MRTTGLLYPAKRGCGPIEVRAEDQEKNPTEPHNAPGNERAISEQSRPRDRGACFAEIHRPRQPCARPKLSNEHHREMEWSGSSRDRQPTVTAACRSCATQFIP